MLLVQPECLLTYVRIVEVSPPYVPESVSRDSVMNFCGIWYIHTYNGPEENLL